MYDICRLLVSPFIVVRYEIHWVSRCMESILALKIAKLYTFSESQSQHGRRIIVSVTFGAIKLLMEDLCQEMF